MRKIENPKEEQDLVGLRLKRLDGKSRVAGYVRREKFEYKILLDTKGRAMRLYRTRGTSNYYLVGSDGKVIWSKSGHSPRSVPLPV